MAAISLDAIYDIDLALTTTDTDPQQHATQQQEQYTTLLQVVQNPSNADERVLSLACALLGRHAGLVPTLASSAATAVVGLFNVSPTRESTPITASLSMAAGDAAISEASLALPTVPTFAQRVRKSAATALVKLVQVMIASASSSSTAVDTSACETFRGQLTLLLESLQEGENDGLGKELGKAMELLKQQLQHLQQQEVKEGEMIASKTTPKNTMELACDVSIKTQNLMVEAVEGSGNPDEMQAETTATTEDAAVAMFPSAAPHVWDPSSANEVLDVIKGAEEGGKRKGKEDRREEDDAVSSQQSVRMPCGSERDQVPDGHFDDDAGALIYHDHGEVTEGKIEAKEGRKEESQIGGGLTCSSSSLSNNVTVAQKEDEGAKEGQASSTPRGRRNSNNITTKEAVDRKVQKSDRSPSSSSSSSFSRSSPRRASASPMTKARNSRSRSRSRSCSMSRSRSRSMSWGSSNSNGSRSWSRSRSRSLSSSRGKDDPREYGKKRSSYGSTRNSNGSGRGNNGKREDSNGRALKKTYDDNVETVEILKQTLATLLELDGSMSPERGFYPDDLRVKLSLSPPLWEEIYDGAKIVPNRSNRLYRSRVRRLIWYVEARLGLPSSLRALRPGEGLEEKRMAGEGGGGGYGRRNGEKKEGYERLGGRRGDERARMPDAGAASAAAAEELVEEQMECEEPTPFVAIKNLSSDFVSLDLLRLIQGCSPNYKVAPWDLLSLRRKGRRGGGVAYLTVGNVKLAQKICDGLEGRKFDGKRLRTEFTLGKPCRDVYVAGVGGMEGWRVREVMEEWGEVLRVEGKNGDRKEKDSDFAFVNYAETGDAVAAIKAIYRCDGEIETNIDNELLSLKATFRPFKGRANPHAGGQGGREGGESVDGEQPGGRDGGRDRDSFGKRGGAAYSAQQSIDGADRFSRRGIEGKGGRGGGADRHGRSAGARSRSPVRRAAVSTGSGSARGRSPPATSSSTAPFHHLKSNKGGRATSRSHDSYDSAGSHSRSRSHSFSMGRSYSRSRSFGRPPHEQLQQNRYQPRQQQQPRFRRYSRSNSPGRLGGDMGGRRASVRYLEQQQRQHQKGGGTFNGGPSSSSSSSSGKHHKPSHQSRKRNRSMDTRGGNEQQQQQQQQQHYHYSNNGDGNNWNGGKGRKDGGEPRKYQRHARDSPMRRVSVTAAVAGAHTNR